MTTNNPWNDVEAFLPMFTDTVGYETVRKNNDIQCTSLAACVFPITDCDPLADFSAETEAKIMNVLITKNSADGWTFQTAPQIGDMITLADNSKWKITRVDDVQTWYDIKTRSI